MATFQLNLDKAIADLNNMSDEDFDKPWTVRRGETGNVQLTQESVNTWLGFQSLVSSSRPAISLFAFA
jgi:hypothetical protein